MAAPGLGDDSRATAAGDAGPADADRGDAGPAEGGESPSERSRPAIRIGAIAAVLLAAGLVTWVLVGRSGLPASEPSAAPPTPATSMSAPAVAAFGPVPMSAADLRALPARVGHEVYWAGAPRQGQQLEVTVRADAATYVRYLRAGDTVGTQTPRTTVVTYAQPDGYALAQQGAARPGAVTAQDTGGALVVAPSATSTSAFFAFDGVPLLVEVFQPKPGAAFTLVQSGRVQMVS